MSDFILQERTLGQMLDETVARFPDREALIYVGHDFRQTWSEFAATVDRLARGLMALGIQGKAIGQTLNTLLDLVIDEQIPNEKNALLSAVDGMR